jgi:thiamine-monophosphate kinase
MAELDIIAQIRARAGAHQSRALTLGIGDDCAILQPPAGHELVVTTDFSLEGRHFTRDRHTPASIGHRALARGLSDLAAMGASPLAAFLSLALPPSMARQKTWLSSFLDGLFKLAAEYKTPLAGGDTSESPSDHILVDILLLGSAEAGTSLRRSTACAGDALYITGTLGGAAAELERVLAAKRPLPAAKHSPHLFPEPRLAAGSELRKNHLATACIDVSDGLSTDLSHLCSASGVRAEIDLAQIPIAPGSNLQQALHGGEDYELLFTSSASVPSHVAGIPVTRIGRILPLRPHTAQVVQIEPGGRRTSLHAEGWEHLR